MGSLALPRNASLVRQLKQGLTKVDWFVLLLVILIAGMLGTLSVMRYTGYNTFMFDLGNMSQAIWSGTQGQPLDFTYEGVNVSRLSLHVEIFYWLLSPLYALFPSPITLLIFQSALFAAGAYPVYRLAKRRLQNKTAARLITLVYMAYPVAQTAVLFDFHGDTLAMPLLMFAIESLDRRAWPSYYIWLLLSLSCKFYVALPVAVMGGILWLLGQKRVGITTFSVAAVWGAVAYFIIRPIFSPASSAGLKFGTLWGYIQFYFGNLSQDFNGTIFARLTTLLIIILPAILLARRAALWLLPAAAIAIPGVLAANEKGFGYFYHHYSMSVPFLVAAIIYGAEKLKLQQATPPETKGSRLLNNWLAAVSATFIFALALNIFLVDTPLNPLFWNASTTGGLYPNQYGNLPRDRFKDQWIAEHVPPGSPLAASLLLMGHMTNRQYLFPLDQLSEVIGKIDYAIPDALLDHDVVLNGVLQSNINYDSQAISLLMNSSQFGLVNAEDGLLLFKKNPAPEDVLLQKVGSSQPGALPSVNASFAEKIGLTKFQLTKLGERRYRLEYDWVTLQAMNKLPAFFAVSRLEGVDQARIIHLPTKILLPTNTWEDGEMVSEVFDVEFRADIPPGNYPLWVGWYDSSNPYAYYTDERSRIGEEAKLAIINLP